MAPNQPLWWQTGIVYQIYPRSFQDSNGDGVGDLPGVLQRLDYIQSLNVDAVWLSPIFPSPMKDFGYDVADYTGIHPLFGSVADFDRLLGEVHARGMKLLLDLVPNHTSDEHAWFQESRTSRDNPKRSWYIWADPAPGGGPPNNWLSAFGGPAWTLDETTGQYYLHQFAREQPELNYRNPQVLAAMLDAMRFWLDKGVDGFRVDVIWMMMKDELLRDNPVVPGWGGRDPSQGIVPLYTQNLPEVHGLIRAMRALLDQYDERMMVGEIYLPFDELVKYYGANLDECHLPFNFHLILASQGWSHPGGWSAQNIRRLVEDYEAALPAGGWPNWVIGNHDQHRVASRVGADQARVASMLLLTLRGTPTYYYGDELGMENVPIPPEFVQDPPAVNQPELASIVGRDPERTPMQWDARPNAGFAAPGVRTWLPLAADYPARNVAAQSADPTSMLSFVRALTRLRRAEPALNRGDYASLDSGSADVFSYLRAAEGGSRFLVALNFSAAEQTLDLSAAASRAKVVLSTSMKRTGSVELKGLKLGPNEGIILLL